ncbi:MAG: FAD-binding oxidoreductase [Nitrososphaerota archaeon]
MERNAELIKELSEFVETDTDVEEYLRDWWQYLSIEGSVKGSAIVVVRPKSEEEVKNVIKFASSHKIPITCRGGGSSVTGSSVPLGGIVVDMSKMDKVVQIDSINYTVTVQAGKKLSDLERELNSLGFTLGHFPQSFHIATVGGFISTMGTGEYSGRYGGIEDSCMSVRVVLPDGKLVETKSSNSPRSSTGPDLTRLFIGAEGYFGIITQAKLKISKIEKYQLKVAYSFSKIDEALSSARDLLGLDIHPAVCRIYEETEASLLLNLNKVVMLLIYTFASDKLGQLIKDELVSLIHGKEEDSALVDKWLEIRFKYREQMDTFRASGLIVDTAELGCGWDKASELYYDTVSALRSLDGVQGVGMHISHIYNQGVCLYFTILFEPSLQLYKRIWDTLHNIMSKNNGTISHHHGVGMLKAEFVKREVPFELLKGIKKSLDPSYIMNNGKLFSNT